MSPFAVFVPADELGTIRPVVVLAGAVIGPFAVVHGGTTVCEQALVEEHTVVGKPEFGYAVGKLRPGVGGGTVVGAGAVVRSGAAVYAGVQIGVNSVIGHHTLLRSAVQVGADTQLGHHLTVERETRIGRSVRCSPGSHLTSSTLVADHVFLGAGVRTINDKTLTWRDQRSKPTLLPPVFGTGAKVGTGSVVMAGVTIGEHSLAAGPSSLSLKVLAPRRHSHLRVPNSHCTWSGGLSSGQMVAWSGSAPMCGNDATAGSDLLLFRLGVRSQDRGYQRGADSAFVTVGSDGRPVHHVRRLTESGLRLSGSDMPVVRCIASSWWGIRDVVVRREE